MSRSFPDIVRWMSTGIGIYSDASRVICGSVTQGSVSLFHQAMCALLRRMCTQVSAFRFVQIVCILHESFMQCRVSGMVLLTQCRCCTLARMWRRVCLPHTAYVLVDACCSVTMASVSTACHHQPLMACCNSTTCTSLHTLILKPVPTRQHWAPRIRLRRLRKALTLLTDFILPDSTFSHCFCSVRRLYRLHQCTVQSNLRSWSF